MPLLSTTPCTRTYVATDDLVIRRSLILKLSLPKYRWIRSPMSSFISYIPLVNPRI
jgi:hypothetical protein